MSKSKRSRKQASSAGRPTASKPPAEVELKFGLPVDQAEAFVGWRPDGGPRAEPTAKHQVSIYYDTPAMHLREAQVALRIRTVGARIIQTVKAAGDPKAGGFSRPEWEIDLQEQAPDLDCFDGERLPPVLYDATVRESLCPVFTTDFVRRSWDVVWEDSTIEFALDTGAVIAGSDRHPIHEVEMELLSGPVDGLLACALRALEEAGFSLLRGSKAEAGYALLAGGPSTLSPRSAEAVPLKPGQSARKAFHRIAREALAQVVGNEAALRTESINVEALRQYRVGLRRLRALATLSRKGYPSPHLAEAAEHLKWLQGETGPARDWDVLCDELLAAVGEALGADADLRALTLAVAQPREKAWERVRAALTSPRHAETHLWVERWLRAMETGIGAAPALEDRIKDVARDILDQRLGPVLAGLEAMANYTPTELHGLRIQVKKLRYATEFFGCLFARKRTERYRDGLKDLRTVLGGANDAHVAMERVAELRQDGLERARGIVTGWALAGIRRDRMDLLKARKKFLDLAPFWRKD